MKDSTRPRVGWWLYVAAIGLLSLFIAYSFVGVLVLGVFGYYATRPIRDQLRQIVDSERVAAMLTVLIVLLPTLLVVLYTGVQVVHQLQSLVDGSGDALFESRIWALDMLPPAQRIQLASVVRTPLSSVAGVSESLWSNVQLVVDLLQAALGTLVLLALSLTLAYGFLSRDDALSTALVELFGGRDTAAYAYATAVDGDLESVFFGNFMFVIVMSFVGTVTYAATNLVAPEGLRIPMVLVLGILTGLTSLVPIVVGKLVYLPVVGLLAVQAVRAGGSDLPFVGAVLVAYFVVLDLVPQSIVQPYLSGRRFDPLLLLLAYLLGPILFGWYGFFLLPILVVLVFELVRIILPNLLHGEPIRSEPTMAGDVGTDPAEATDDPAAGGDDADDVPPDTT